MSYLNDVYYLDSGKGLLYKLSNDAVATGYPVATKINPTAILVASDMITTLVASYSENVVSVFKNGVLTKTVKVGKGPMGLCEARDGRFYITNTNSNTVTVLDRSFLVVATINVGRMPRGICCDANNNIYVANYGSSSVSKIVNVSVVNTYKVGYNPSGICCDKHDNVWTANSGNSTFSKITKDGDVTNLSLPAKCLPYDICIDKEGNKWITSSSNNSVYKVVGERVATQVIVGEEPQTVCTTDTGIIYVFNTGDGTISKISGKTVVQTIPAVIGMDGSFGDCTGYQNYYIQKTSINPSTGGSGGLGDIKISYTDLDDSLKEMIDHANELELPIDDKDVNHPHDTYDTVKKALDHLLYVSPVIKTLNLSKSREVEIGTTVNGVTINWDINKEVETLKLNGTSVVGRTSYNDSEDITTDKTWTLVATDAEGTTVSKSVSMKFLNKVYWGASTDDDIVNTTEVLTLPENKLASAKSMSATFDCSGGKYIYFAMPSSFKLDASNFTIGGLANSNWTSKKISFTNEQGHTSDYDVFKLNDIQNGSSIKVVIS